MTSPENNRRQDYRPVGAFTALAHSLTESKLSGLNAPQLEHNHTLQCDAFRLEYVTQLTDKHEKLKSLYVVPSGPVGYREGRYTFSPEPSAEVSAKILQRLNQAHTSRDIGVVLLKDLLSFEIEFPSYTWKASQSVDATGQSCVAPVTPILAEFKEFVAHPKWVPHYGMKSLDEHETNWVSAVIHDESINCKFRTTTTWTEEDAPLQSLQVRYSGPPLSPEENPSVIGERVTSGLKAIMGRAQEEGALSTHAALVANTFKPPFLEPVATPSKPLDETLRRPILRPQQHTLKSGATTNLRLDHMLGAARVEIHAHAKAGASMLSYDLSVVMSYQPQEWVADVSEAYRLLSAPSESMRLAGLYALRGLSSMIDYKVPDVGALLGEAELAKVLAIAADYNMLVGGETGPNFSVANMLALCDGIQQVGFILTKEKLTSTLYRELLLGFDPDGSLHFSAKNDVGGAFEGRLYKSMFKVLGDRGKAVKLLVEGFGKQQSVRQRQAFEHVARTLVDMDQDGYSYVLSEGTPSFCALPPSDDKEGLRAYDLGGAIVQGFCSTAKIPVRASVNYLERGACETLVSYPGAPFEMRFVIRGNTLREVRFSPALPLHADPIKRQQPVLQASANLDLLDRVRGTEVTGTLLLNYLKYARESMDPRTAQSLVESDVYEVARSLEAPSGA
jgi:hypothetical protein